MEKIHDNVHVLYMKHTRSIHESMKTCMFYACFHVFSPFSAYFSPHDVVVEKGLFTAWDT